MISDRQPFKYMLSLIEKLSVKTGHAYRLPSEAEWEFAALAGLQTEYPLADGSIKDFEDKTGILHGFIDAKASRAQMDSEAAGLLPVMDRLNLIKKK